jgi:hypothetical protein
MKREKMLSERRCGLKYWDKAVDLVGRERVIEEAIAISQRYPDIWNGGWANFEWAIGNAVREAIDANGNPQMTWNTNDVLDEAEMAYVAKALSLPLEDYAPLYPHS